eukprot:scaffold154011_cov31-Tisochrysis_lutea.AAC.3
MVGAPKQLSVKTYTASSRGEAQKAARPTDDLPAHTGPPSSAPSCHMNGDAGDTSLPIRFLLSLPSFCRRRVDDHPHRNPTYSCGCLILSLSLSAPRRPQLSSPSSQLPPQPTRPRGRAPPASSLSTHPSLPLVLLEVPPGTLLRQFFLA